MFTVAVIGPDGAGKSTVIESLQNNTLYPMRRIYMGVNPDSSTHMLPTTRLVNYLKGRRRKASAVRSSNGSAKANKDNMQHKASGLKPMLGGGKSLFFIVNRFGEAWYRQTVCWYYLRRGYIVLFDRHIYLDRMAYKFAHPGEAESFLRRIYYDFLEKTYPRPDLTIYLDAPAEVLYARKKESTIEKLGQMREAYLRLQNCTPSFRIVDTMQSPEKVLEAVLHHIDTHRETLKKAIP